MTSDLLITADTCFLTIAVLLDLSVALVRFLALSFRRDLHPLYAPCLFHHISLSYHTKFIFCFCWGAPGSRFGASFIHCLHASTQSRFRNTVLAFTVTRMTLRCIFFHPSTHLPLWLPHGGHSMVLLPHFPKIINNKMEVLLVSTASTPTKSQKFSINFDNSSILLSPQSFQSHINHITQSAYFHLVSVFSSPTAAAILVQSLVTSSADYCNPPLFGLSKTSLHKLFQSPLAQIITHSLQRAHHSGFSTAPLAAGRF